MDFVISYLTGKPLDWASNLLRINDPILDSYEGFVDALKNTFGEYCYESIVANGKLDTLKQRRLGDVTSYINEFQRISQRSNFNDNALMFMFLCKKLSYEFLQKSSFFYKLILIQITINAK